MSNKGTKTDLEKELRILMIQHDVSQTELAAAEGVSLQAINNRLNRLNRPRARAFADLIERVAAEKRDSSVLSKAVG